MADAAVVELRQYTLKPGARACLLDVFETHLVEPQEDAGMCVGGTFEDRDDADRFVWMRGFCDMEARRRALEAFYLGPVWAAHRSTANPTMIDADDVLLLRPTEPAHPPWAPRAPRADVGATAAGDEWVAITAYTYEPDAAFSNWLADDVHAALEDAFRAPVAAWRTEPAPNTFPQLRVRTDHAFVWLSTFADEDAYRSAHCRFQATSLWSDELAPQLADRGATEQQLRLRPTARSQHPAAMHREPGGPRRTP